MPILAQVHIAPKESHKIFVGPELAQHLVGLLLSRTFGHHLPLPGHSVGTSLCGQPQESRSRFLEYFRGALMMAGTEAEQAQTATYNRLRRFLPTLANPMQLSTLELQAIGSWKFRKADVTRSAGRTRQWISCPILSLSFFKRIQKLKNASDWRGYEAIWHPYTLCMVYSYLNLGHSWGKERLMFHGAYRTSFFEHHPGETAALHRWRRQTWWKHGGIEMGGGCEVVGNSVEWHGDGSKPRYRIILYIFWSYHPFTTYIRVTRVLTHNRISPENWITLDISTDECWYSHGKRIETSELCWFDSFDPQKSKPKPGNVVPHWELVGDGDENLWNTLKYHFLWWILGG